VSGAPVQFRDPRRAAALAEALQRAVDRAGRRMALMHVCGSHEQAMARYGLRASFPKELDVIMGPGCPVCVTDQPEVDDAVALAQRGVTVATYGDMLRVPGTSRSLADARSEGGRVEIVYGVSEAVRLARETDGEVVFFASGFETTAVATAAEILRGPPANFSVLSAHKYILPAMEVVARIPETRVEGFLAAGHAASITGSGIFEPFAARHRVPVVVAGFEPLDILAALVRLAERAAAREPGVENLYPRCVTREGNLPALRQMWRVFETATGRWRGIADIPDGNLRLRDEFAHLDARRRFDLQPAARSAPAEWAARCICGSILSGTAMPSACPLFGNECSPATPVGACMVSSEGACRIWHQYGGPRGLGSEA
jgi:hydrogenase expression/formation protein HypD